MQQLLPPSTLCRLPELLALTFLVLSTGRTFSKTLKHVFDDEIQFSSLQKHLSVNLGLLYVSVFCSRAHEFQTGNHFIQKFREQNIRDIYETFSRDIYLFSETMPIISF